MRVGICPLETTTTALQVAVQEMRRLQKYGVTQSEMERYTMALLRDTEQGAQQASAFPSVDMLDYTMESFGCGHVVSDQGQVGTLSLP